MHTGYRTVKTACCLLTILAAQTAGSQMRCEAAKADTELFAMDTFMTVTAYGDDAQAAVDEAAEEINRLDALLSTGDSGSEIYQINQDSSGILSEDTAYLVERSLALYQETDGAFDIAIYPVMEAWGFTTDQFRVPEESELEALLGRCDAGAIQYDSESKEISFDMDGMMIDLGGITKGYTSGRIMDIFQKHGVTSGLVNLGGNVQTYGTKTDGTLWRVAVQDPADSSEYIGILSVSDQAVITSGGYERYFEEDGITYHHIIDPTTGYPADNGLISVTIVSDDGTLADGLSTSLYIMGLDKAEDYWKNHQDQFDMVLMTDEREIYVSEGIAEQFDSEYEWNIITGNED